MFERLLMRRNMDLVRLILLKIEDEYRSTAIFNIDIPGYDMETVAYHCKILNEAGLISAYNAQYGSNELMCFAVGPLTWDGNEYLDKVRDDSQWAKVKNVIISKGVPLAIDTIKSVSDAFVTAATEGIVNSIIKNTGILP